MLSYSYMIQGTFKKIKILTGILLNHVIMHNMNITQNHHQHFLQIMGKDFIMHEILGRTWLSHSQELVLGSNHCTQRGFCFAIFPICRHGHFMGLALSNRLTLCMEQCKNTTVFHKQMRDDSLCFPSFPFIY